MTPKHHEKNNVKGHSSTSLKYIFVTGGVMSGLGKGILSSSISALLEARGYKVEPIKIDGYLNVDAGTMNPIEHGEVFVLDDGTECDMDLGNYERFLDKALTSENSLTTGKIMQSVIQKERRGEYLGKTVQMIPHVTGEIKQWIRNAAKKSDADFVVVEIGGTVGDLENQMFIEAAREIHSEEPKRTVAFVHLTLVPVMGVVGEQKSKPTQHSIKELQHMGIRPNIIVARSEKKLEKKIINKIKLFGDVRHVISDPDLKSIYEAPLFFEEEGLMGAIDDVLDLTSKKSNLVEWNSFVENLKDGEKTITIAITGKYVELHDA
ncbi:MAG: CTP synthase, partial [Candidatus Aenigmarchaeota archaeon]|nr:CTP synthase [Candidatus Aenigmarchaeota archaeon]